MKKRLEYSLIGVLISMSASWSSGALASDDAKHAQALQHHATAPQHHMPTPQHNERTGAFVKVVRDATRRFRDVSVAVAEGYVLQFGCVSGSDDEGAMGVHFVNGPLVADGVLDPARPELLVYEPTRNGQMRLVAADYLVFSEAWHANNAAAPELMGQLFHLFDNPNRFGLPVFYT
ncbi:MAG: hypothetical protein ACREV5_22365, partial [Steroidobacter sp.]